MTSLSRRGFLAVAVLPAAKESPGRALARRLADLYSPGSMRSRWSRDAMTVEIGGRSVPRRLAYRDDSLFPSACECLLDRGNPFEARLGAWLLEGASGSNRHAAIRVAQAHLMATDAVTRFHILKSLLDLGDREAVIRATRDSSEPHEGGLLTLARGTARSGAPNPAASTPGACFWFEGHEDDFGASQFAKLSRFGVSEVSIHTFDPLQQGKHHPVLRESRRAFSVPNLSAWVAAARRASIDVTFKPHLEMGFRQLTDTERRILGQGSEAERQGLRATVERERAEAGWHGDIEMKSAADWKRWFEGYSSYLLSHAGAAALAGASTFCVGREIDKTVMAREASWRDLIKQVRGVFKGRLVYSAHHDTFDRLPFWDALDVIGVSAYPQVDTAVSPRMAEARAGWTRFVSRCDALATRDRRPLAWCEVGYPAVDTAAGEPWRENTSEANVMLQSNLLAAALGAARGSKSIRGTCVWLWEGVSEPPFKDRSFTIQDKPAAFAMAGVYRR